jgi:non-heme chloroperoxidase
MKRASLTALVLFITLVASAQTAPKSRFFTTSDGVRIHFLEAGKGPAIVFIPGWTMPAWIWEKQIAHFALQYRVIAVDPRSQGESDKVAEGNYPERRARDYKELVDHLKLAPAVLVGWSMGVAEILAYANQFGAGDLRGVVLVDGFVVLDEGVQKLFPLWMHTVAMDRKAFANGFIPSMCKKPQSASYYQRLIADSLKTPTNTAVELGILGRPDWSNALPKLAQTPVLLVASKPLINQIDAARAAIPNLRSEVFEDAGHALFVDEPERFNAVLQQFIEGAQAK